MREFTGIGRRGGGDVDLVASLFIIKNPLNQVSQKYTKLMVIYFGYNLRVGCLVLRRTSIFVQCTTIHTPVGQVTVLYYNYRWYWEIIKIRWNIIMWGFHFNARTACLDDFVKNDYISTHIQTGNGYSVDKPKHNILRQNKDAKVSNWGGNSQIYVREVIWEFLMGEQLGIYLGISHTTRV